MSEELKLTPGQTLAFFASVIKSGEPWTGTCQKAYDEAMAALSSPRVEEVRREALEKAAEQFEFYGREHREKAHASRGNGLAAAADSSDAKALTNETFAALCRAALSPPVVKDTP